MRTDAISLSLLALALLSSARAVSDGAFFETDCNESKVGKDCTTEVAIAITGKPFETTTVEVKGKCIEIEAGRVSDKVSELRRRDERSRIAPQGRAEDRDRQSHAY